MGWIHGEDSEVQTERSMSARIAPANPHRELANMVARQLVSLEAEVLRLQQWEGAEKNGLKPFYFFRTDGTRVPVEGHRIVKTSQGHYALWLEPKMRAGSVVPCEVEVRDCPCFESAKAAAQFRAAMERR